VLVAFIPGRCWGAAEEEDRRALENPAVVAWALMVGGIAIIVIERLAKPGAYRAWANCPWPRRVVGVMQCLAMVPGVSRSGATIMGALGMGINRARRPSSASSWPFPPCWAPPPSRCGTTATNWPAAPARGPARNRVGSLVSFVVALVVIKGFVAYISRGFAPFAIYRILAGGAALYALSHIKGRDLARTCNSFTLPVQGGGDLHKDRAMTLFHPDDRWLWGLLAAAAAPAGHGAAAA
jgi:undecaprenyl-diphosphatase